MKKTNKLIPAILSLSTVVTVLSGMTVTSANDITVELSGTDITFDIAPQIIDGCTMVPLRKIFEEIGALVKWDNDTQTVSARKNSKTVTFTINSANLKIDKGDTDDDGNPIAETVALEVPAQIVSGRTLVPIRAISEAFGLNVDWDGDNQKVIITSDDDEDDSWKENTGTVNLSDLTYTGNGIEIADNRILITEGGDFTLTGTLDDGNITISTKEKVKLRLSGAAITSSEGPCIFVEDADKAYITITDNTENTLTAENSEDGAIYSKDNLEIKGSGTLTIISPAGHAVKASDSLTIENGNINLEAFGDGIHINDTFKMTGGNVNIKSIGDGIDSESIVIISGGVLNIETNGVPTLISPANQYTGNTENTPENIGRGRMMEQKTSVEFEKSSKGINAEWMMCISAGEITLNSASHAVHCGDEIEITGGCLTINSEYEKGISAHGNLTVSNSDTVINIVKSTEGLESKKTAEINDGTIKIVASDDGINATGGRSGEMPGGGQKPERMPDGQQNPERMPDVQKPERVPDGQNPERMPGRQKPESMPGGTNNREPIAPPDNTVQGVNRISMGGSNMSDCLVINGGNIEVFAKDDCLDANGNLVLNGGIIKAVKVNGSFTGPNSVLDADGKLSVNQGVTLIAAGSGGTQGGLTISQNTITFYSEHTHNAGESITVKDESGNVIVEYTPDGSYSAVLITSPDLEIGKNYTVSLGTETQAVTISSQNTSVGTQKNSTSGRIKGMQ